MSSLKLLEADAGVTDRMAARVHELNGTRIGTLKVRSTSSPDVRRYLVSYHLQVSSHLFARNLSASS